MRTRTLLYALLLLVLPIQSGCGKDDSSAKAEATSGIKEPTTFPTQKLEGDKRLDLSAKVRLESGEEVSLEDLLRDPSLLLYINGDTDDRQNRAATRFVRKIVSRSRGVNFRTVILFSKGMKKEEIAGWFKKRGVKRNAAAAIDHEGAFAQSSRWFPRTAAIVDSKGQLGPIFEPTEEWDRRLGLQPGLSSDALFRAFEAPRTTPSVDQATMDAAADLVRAALNSDWEGKDLPEDLRGLAKAAGLGKKLEHGLYVTLYRRGSTKPLRGSADPGSPFGRGLAQATHAALASAGDDSAAWAKDGAVNFSIDLPGAKTPVPTRYMKTLWYLIEAGVDGISLSHGDMSATVLPADAVTHGFLTPRVRGRASKMQALMRHATRSANLGLDDWKREEVLLERFRTTAFGVVEPSGPAVPMFRGNVLLDEDPSEADMMASIKLGGQWLVNTVQESGKFDYEYFPNKDGHSTDYNIVRHAGSVYGLIEMWHVAQTEGAIAPDAERYLDAAARAMSFIYEALGTPNGADDDRICLLERDKRNRCQSGSAALALLTFLARPEKKDVPKKFHKTLYRDDDDALIRGLGLTLTDVIDRGGKVFRTYKESRKNETVKKEPLYYPGESMLALMHLYNKTQDQIWLEAAKKIGKRQIGSYRKDRFQTPDHWVMQAYLHLWRATKDDKYAKSAYAMATHYASEQYPIMWGAFPDYFGSWRRGSDQPRTTRAGSRSEALRSVMKLAWERGDDASDYENSLIWAARHLIEQQFRPENSFWVPVPKKTMGAYRMGLVDNHCRIDNNQHVLVGMMGAVEALRRRGEG